MSSAPGVQVLECQVQWTGSAIEAICAVPAVPMRVRVRRTAARRSRRLGFAIADGRPRNASGQSSGCIVDGPG